MSKGQDGHTSVAPAEIVDVGGGTGALLAAILRAAATARGILGQVGN